MAEAKKAPAPAESAEAPKPKRNIVLYVVIGLLVLIVVGMTAVAGYLFFALSATQTYSEPVASEAGTEEGHEGDKASEKKKKKKKDKANPEAPPVFVKLDTYTVNLQGGGSVLQTEIHVQVIDEKQKELITGYLPRISSQVNLLLSSKKAEDVATLEAKVKLMDEIKNAINRVLGARDEEDGVMSVEFKTFIVQ
ncbi:flagellar basal body-associated FliL family protein [Chitinimonas lacunae]|uniref:Flagellar protein FliL n=1 Tax=Chitinimonas lacunae TaxID=1963018 RepID=A0ABV8MY46_9NEIS